MGLCHSHTVYIQTDMFTAIEPLRGGAVTQTHWEPQVAVLWYHVSL